MKKFDVGSGLVGEGVLALEAFNKNNVWPEARWVDAWGRGSNAREWPMWEGVLTRAVKEDIPLMRHFH